MSCKYILFPVLIFFLLPGCQVKNSDEKLVTAIPVQVDENHRIEAGKYLVGIDSLTIHANEGDWISEVQDLCMNDSWIFILDINQTVFKVDVHTGSCVFEKRGCAKSWHTLFHILYYI